MTDSARFAGRLRFPTEASLGRAHPELPPDPEDSRDIFEHDRDRIVHSHAFRRLAGKTQVISLPDWGHSRTRLTHTIEVAYLARSVATALGLNVALAETLALGHDLGHPPFGHAGERVLDAEMKRFGSSFDHNFHGLRIIEHFEHRYAAFRGLNLTFEVREGALKHSRDLEPGNPAYRDYLPHLKPLLEAQLIDLVDEIAYLTADLEDAVEFELLSFKDCVNSLPFLEEIIATVHEKHPDTAERQLSTEVHSRLISLLVRDLILGTDEAARESGAKNWEDVRSLPDRIAGPTQDAREKLDAMRSLLEKNYYDAIEVERAALRYSEHVRDVFRHFIDHPEQLKDRYREQLATGEQNRARLVCDYVAGMTDSYLVRCHAEIFPKLDS